MIVDLPELMRVMGYIREALIKSVHGEPAKPRTDELPLIFTAFPVHPSTSSVRTGDLIRASLGKLVN